MQIDTFNATNYHALCDALALKDQRLASILKLYGYPPFWSRPNTFESLIHIILEQQVSLSAALAAIEKLRQVLPEFTPESFLMLNDEVLKSCYFSRQKIGYARDLAIHLSDGRLDLLQLETLHGDEVRQQLIRIKGIGNWTIDIYLLMILHRTDVFPKGDLAAMNGLRKLAGTSETVPKEELATETLLWKPYRSIATMLIWHLYLAEGKNIADKKSVIDIISMTL